MTATAEATEVERPWLPARDAPEDVVVETKIDDKDGPRNVTPLRRRGGLWFAPSGDMYVYYTPTHFRTASRALSGDKP